MTIDLGIDTVGSVMTKYGMGYFLHIGRDPKAKHRTYGPMTYQEAREFGKPFLEEGHDVELHPADEPICDFCSSKEVTWSYNAEDFSVPEAEWGSRGGWAACDTCHDLIEADQREALLLRSVETFFIRHEDLPDNPENRQILRSNLEDLHGRFFTARIGNPERL